MGLFAYLIALAVSGLFVGGLARLALPGRDPMGILATIGVGLLGSFIAGLVTMAIWGRNVGGITLSILFATVIVYFIRRSRGGTLTRPAPDGRYQRNDQRGIWR
jgi:uncharacterized membrane protein YeaQ/YmgE (transglycosylase-associated protein family)